MSNNRDPFEEYMIARKRTRELYKMTKKAYLAKMRNGEEEEEAHESALKFKRGEISRRDMICHWVHQHGMGLFDIGMYHLYFTNEKLNGADWKFAKMNLARRHEIQIKSLGLIDKSDLKILITQFQEFEEEPEWAEEEEMEEMQEWEEEEIEESDAEED